MKSSFTRLRSAFTLVELLVVIAIIGVLIALLLPAVQQAREAARRMQCTNHHKQLGLAMHNYDSTFNVLPYAHSKESGLTTHKRDGWFQRILPFVEQTALADIYKADTSVWCHQMPTTIRDVVVPTLTCPSDPNGPGFGAAGDSHGFQGNIGLSMGVGNWTFSSTNPNEITITGASLVSYGSITVKDPGGMFFENSGKTFRDCVDGTANTLLASESVIRGNGNNGWGELGGYWGGGMHGASGFSVAETPNTSVPDRVHTCKALAAEGAPQGAPCENGSAGGLTGRWNYARSYHPGGVNAAMVDGSVHFFSNNIDRQVWMRLGLRADGLVVGEY